MNAVIASEAGLGAKSVFERLLEQIDKHTERFDQDKFQLGDFYSVVIEFEEQFKKFNSSGSNNIKLLNSILEDTVGRILYIFEVFGFVDSAIFFAFKRFIVLFTFILKESGSHVSQADIVKNFYENFPSLESDWVNADVATMQKVLSALADSGFDIKTGNFVNGNVSIFRKRSSLIQDYFVDLVNSFPEEIGESVERSSKELSIYCNDFIIKTIIWGNRSNYKILKQQYYTKIAISIDDKNNSASRLLAPIYLIISALEQIENVHIEIERISKGSLNINVEARSNDLVAKEELKIALESAREQAIKDLANNPIVSSDLDNQHEAARLDLEVKKLSLEALMQPAADIKISQRLDNERKKLENELLKAEILKAKLQALRVVSDIIKEGIIQADEIKIEINGVPYLIKNSNGGYEIGPSINEIA